MGKSNVNRPKTPIALIATIAIQPVRNIQTSILLGRKEQTTGLLADEYSRLVTAAMPTPIAPNNGPHWWNNVERTQIEIAKR